MPNLNLAAGIYIRTVGLLLTNCGLLRDAPSYVWVSIKKRDHFRRRAVSLLPDFLAHRIVKEWPTILLARTAIGVAEVLLERGAEAVFNGHSLCCVVPFIRSCFKGMIVS